MDDDVDIKCTHVIPVGNKGGPCPVIHALAWNPNPGACSEANSSSMIGCLSSNGVQIYNLQKKHKKWTSMDIAYRPASEGTSLEWHEGGQALAAATNRWRDRPGILSILSYDGKDGFRSRTALQCPEGEYICSLCWGVHDFYLILALRPSSTICFMRFKDVENPDSLEFVERAHFKDHFVEGSHITLVPNRTHSNLFVYSRDKFMVLDNIGQSTADVLRWEIIKVIKVPSNIPGMVYDSRDHGLFTIDLDKWSYWKMDERRQNQDYMTIVASSDGNELSRRKGKRGHSEYMSIAVSKSGRFFATGGKDCLCYHEKTRGEYAFEMVTLGCRTHDVNYGHVTCIQFNPMELDTRRLATGGDTGNIHIWAIGKKGKVKVTEAKRVKEHEKKYYSRPFGVTDRQVDDVVVDLKMPCVTLKPDDIRVVKEESTTEVAAETSGSSDAIESVDADVFQNIAAVEESAGVEDVAAVDKSAKTSTSSAPFNTQGQTAADYSSVTLSDELASINEEAAELHRSQTGEMSQHPYRKTFDRLHDVAGKAIHNVMSLGAQADAMLDRIDELTKDDFKEFLKKASTAQRGKL